VTPAALGDQSSVADGPAPAGRSTAGAPVVSVEGIWKRFGATDVVRDLSFEVRAGELLGFLGPNGAGKTTAMRMILDIIRPERGRIRVFGEQPGVGVQSRVGYLPEERGLYRDVPVVDTLTYFGALKGLSTREARRRARRLLEEVGLGEALRKKGAELSRGMHQKAQVVATILHEPDLLIVDEPFQGLDPLNTDLLRRIILAQRERGAAVIMSTHDMDEAQLLCDRVLLIERGRRLLYGTVRDVRASFSDGAVVVRGEGIPIEPGSFKSVHEALRSNGSVRFILRDGARPQDLFRELAATDVAVERFEVASPSLTEIFIRAVEGDRRAVESDRRAGTPS
jgi:ABC-2 type transport system ATP-binding protein